MRSCCSRYAATAEVASSALLDEGGLTTREIADQLGHKPISMTQDVCFGRQAASPKVAAVLEAIGEIPSRG